MNKWQLKEQTKISQLKPRTQYCILTIYDILQKGDASRQDIKLNPKFSGMPTEIITSSLTWLRLLGYISVSVQVTDTECKSVYSWNKEDKQNPDQVSV